MKTSLMFGPLMALLLALSGCDNGSSNKPEIPVLSEAEREAAAILKIQDTVSSSNIIDHLSELQKIAEANNGNRASGTSGYTESAIYFKEQLEAAGYTVTEQRFEHQPFLHVPFYPGESINLIAEIPSSADRPVIMLGAHLDSVPEGPGINDNGSGSATLLEIAIQMAVLNVEPKNTLRFAWWGAEELGTQGSLHYMNSLSSEQKDSIAVYLNFDMIGAKNAVRTVYVNDDPVDSANAETLFSDFFKKRDLSYESHIFFNENISDHYSYTEEGIPNGGISDNNSLNQQRGAELAQKYGGSESDTILPECYHKSCDTVEMVDEDTLKLMADAIVEVSYKLAADINVSHLTARENSVQVRLNTLGQYSNTAMLECPERIWPNYDWKDKQVIFFSQRKSLAVLWNNQADTTDSTSLTAIDDYSTLPPQWTSGDYALGVWNDVDTIFLNADSSADRAAVLAFHEGFHFFGQEFRSNLPPEYQLDARAQPVPGDPQPRILRAEIMASLFEAVIQGKESSFAHAAFWQNKYTADYPDERTKNALLDILEGSAEYVGERAFAIAKLGCDSSELALYESLKTHRRYGNLNDILSHPVTGGESYLLGGLSGFALEFKQISDWQGLVELGSSPTDILANNISEVADTLDIQREASLRSAYDQQNSDNLKIVESYFSLREQENTLMVNIPSEWVGSGSFGLSSILAYQKNNVSYEISGLEGAQFKDPEGQGALDIVGTTFTESSTPTLSPCDGVFFSAFPLPSSDIEQLEKTGQLNTAAQQFSNIRVSRKTDSSGKEWACLY